jgi:hypothetical protein
MVEMGRPNRESARRGNCHLSASKLVAPGRTAGGGLLVVGGLNYALAALSADTGREVWARLTGMRLIPSPPDSPAPAT